MRLWHKRLLCVLPTKQLISQWRELCCIAKNVKEKGSPNHILVNKILDYDKTHFVAYTKLVIEEFHKRNYRINENAFQNFLTYLNLTEEEFNDISIPFSDIYENWHNNRYFTQCYYNLQEKYDCGAISKDEWFQI